MNKVGACPHCGEWSRLMQEALRIEAHWKRMEAKHQRLRGDGDAATVLEERATFLERLAARDFPRIQPADNDLAGDWARLKRRCAIADGFAERILRGVESRVSRLELAAGDSA